MVYIVLSIIGLIATLTVKSTWSLRTQIFFILLSIIMGAFIFVSLYFVLEEMGIIEKSNYSIISQIPWKEIGLYFSMILGMAAKYVYDWIGTGKGQQRKFRKWQLFKPMLVSPIMFGSIYGSVDQNTSTILLLVFAFQNGFFWQTVLKKSND